MIYLASRSPRRRELLGQLGVSFRILDVETDESVLPGESCDVLVRRLAMAKAEAGDALLDVDERAPVLGADTIVLLGDAMLGKPHDEARAREMLMSLSGRSHSVLTAVALVAEGVTRTRMSESRVWFREISEKECRVYCASSEPLDKAGAYAIQGGAAAFIARLDGSYSGVVGLPLYETSELLIEAGVEIFRSSTTDP